MNTKLQKIGHILTSSILLTGLSIGIQQQAQASLAIDSTQAEETTTTEHLISYATDQRFLLKNNRSKSIHYFYASPSYLDDWENDILGRSVLQANDSTWININDNRESCIYDFLAIFSDGSEASVYNINICELSSYTF